MNNARYKTLIIIIIILVLINIGMALYFTLGKPGPRFGRTGRKWPMTEFLQKEIGFSSQQLAALDSIRQRLREGMRPYGDALGRSRDSLYQLLGEQAFDDTTLQARAEAVGHAQAEMEQRMFKYLREVRALCTPEQRRKFDSLAPATVGKLFFPQHRPKK